MYSLTALAAQVNNLSVQVQACCQSMHASSTCKSLAIQHKCIAQAPLLCLTRTSSLQAAMYSSIAHVRYSVLLVLIAGLGGKGGEGGVHQIS